MLTRTNFFFSSPRRALITRKKFMCTSSYTAREHIRNSLRAKQLLLPLQASASLFSHVTHRWIRDMIIFNVSRCENAEKQEKKEEKVQEWRNSLHAGHERASSEMKNECWMELKSIFIFHYSKCARALLLIHFPINGDVTHMWVWSGGRGERPSKYFRGQ